ncbi:uncharacterized protein LOC107221949 [Neodiprion lecontei]|uniref:Uncharacterized protein LOC107221949 n=1 Tax=Neodiprion lecontei TaxID=441921 RepID=A0ABM3FK04_NEOLC|nr:uncharacterized protein LOC107221949 [Neodiprion lecontei]
MGNLATVVRLGAAFLPYLMDYARGEEESRGCVMKEGRCVKCRGGTILHRGTCVQTCPSGYTEGWLTQDDYMGKVCKESNYMFGLTGSQVAILVGVVSGATICIFIILCGVVVVHRRKRKAAKLVQQFEDSAERREFLKHLATLRGEANTFLSMLNDTRRQVREIYYAGNNGDGAVGVQAYRPVLRDLARILVLVNRRDDEIPFPPDDWQRLLAWAERLLRRYKRHSSPEVAQLVTFLQQPANSIPLAPPQPIAITQQTQPYEPRATPTNLTTFQANMPLTTFQASEKSSISPAGSSLGYAKDNHSPIGSSLGQNSCSVYNEKLSPNGSTLGQTVPLVYGDQKRGQNTNSNLQELAVSTFNHNYNSGAASPQSDSIGIETESSILDRELNPQWEFQSPVEAANYTILSDWLPNRDYLVDDFTILGFRPQDEITTEL